MIPPKPAALFGALWLTSWQWDFRYRSVRMLGVISDYTLVDLVPLAVNCGVFRINGGKLIADLPDGTVA